MHNHTAIAIISPIVPIDIKSTSMFIHIIIIIIIYHFPLVEKLMTKQWENRNE
jgi:hypothetical protein